MLPGDHKKVGSGFLLSDEQPPAHPPVTSNFLAQTKWLPSSVVVIVVTMMLRSMTQGRRTYGPQGARRETQQVWCEATLDATHPTILSISKAVTTGAGPPPKREGGVTKTHTRENVLASGTRMAVYCYSDPGPGCGASALLYKEALR